MGKRKRSYHDVLSSWDGEQSHDFFDALGRLALGDMGGRMIGSMFFAPIGKRVYQLIEIAVDEGIRRQTEKVSNGTEGD